VTEKEKKAQCVSERCTEGSSVTHEMTIAMTILENDSLLQVKETRLSGDSPEDQM
jgi:hypothetical protein